MDKVRQLTLYTSAKLAVLEYKLLANRLL